MAKMFGLSEKVGDFTIIEAFGVAVAKTTSERLLQPIIGNGTLMSGALKGVAGALIGGMGNGKITKTIATGLIVDAGEDLVNFVMPSTGLASLTTAPSNQNSRVVM